jgi:hypothetical protein
MNSAIGGRKNHCKSKAYKSLKSSESNQLLIGIGQVDRLSTESLIIA